MERHFDYTMPDKRKTLLPFLVIPFGFTLYLISRISIKDMESNPLMILNILACVIACLAAVWYVLFGQTRIKGGFHIQEGKLLFVTVKNGREQKTAIAITEISNIDNGEEEFAITAPQGEFRFTRQGFKSPADYNEFLNTIQKIRFNREEAAQ